MIPIGTFEIKYIRFIILHCVLSTKMLCRLIYLRLHHFLIEDKYVENAECNENYIYKYSLSSLVIFILIRHLEKRS